MHACNHWQGSLCVRRNTSPHFVSVKSDLHQDFTFLAMLPSGALSTSACIFRPNSGSMLLYMSRYASRGMGSDETVKGEPCMSIPLIFTEMK